MRLCCSPHAVRSIAPALSPLGVLGKLVVLNRDVQQTLSGEVVLYQ